MVKQTFVYKVVGDCNIEADVYRGPGAANRAAIIYIHGGCLISSDRRGPSDKIAMFVGAGYTVVSIDYRLAPETKIEGIVEDLKDACNWVYEKGPSLFGIDPDRIGVTGDSAGGYLTLMSGYLADHHPKALVSFYGYAEIVGEWYSKPNPFYLQQPLVPESVARASVGTQMISGSTSPERRKFYLYCRQNGLWPKEVTGHDPDTEREALTRYCPIDNVSVGYPPTLLLHGENDTDVPYGQAVIMANRLAHVGIEHELVTIRGGGHGFDSAGIQDAKVADALDRTLAFFKKHLRANR